ncbi:MULTISPECIES: class C sortase [unclassified Breznakia]|uniref:class C sortase n=1 Tax=unclassified Breznakia TaxID=2623764 RepID=UPI0024730ED6|nr:MULTISPECIES: class C sortase [unclassified Breznakia]MDH6365968.1 sortase A [Breznakia sp. PH1-1]MDH6403100.1 sortase A [Breznakia sp. PF1-11]MDH6410809.1 sortase A [Breznakia sp. PFB1-11]MDH6413134.1 sortase A [Breznakia sp. PFB1-14]MDH6415502.1 sortase A [Breznakia sp. PFB1-4]
MKVKKTLVALLFLGGFALLMYPVVSNILATMQEEKVIASYQQNIDTYSQEKVDEEMKKAKEYNASISGENIQDPFIQNSGTVLPENYSEILDIGNGVMAYIEIPAIDVKLPIYHGTSEKVLQKGVGHLLQTSLPIGGPNNHTVLSGHRGLPQANLFTDLVDLEVGDTFYVHVLNDTLKYEVDQIKTVYPHETDELLPVVGEDYITLVTCVPYGVNTERLLVRGTRVAYEVEHQNTVSNNQVLKRSIRWPYIFGSVVLAGVGGYIYFKKRKKKDENKEEGRK